MQCSGEGTKRIGQKFHSRDRTGGRTALKERREVGEGGMW